MLWGLFSTWQGFHEYTRELNDEYIEGNHDLYQGMDIIITLAVLCILRGYHQYNWRYHEYIKVLSTWRDIVSTLQDVQYIEGIS